MDLVSKLTKLVIVCMFLNVSSVPQVCTMCASKCVSSEGGVEVSKDARNNSPGTLINPEFIGQTLY